jgi:EAL domain-containing protein (putative c-di-GMP-specific phosphodiesterase class I)
MNAPDLLKRADIALYSAKKTQLGTVLAYEPSMEHLFEQSDRALRIVRTAFEQKRLAPFYQPKVRLADQALQGFEALVRVLSDDGRVVGPSAFGPAFEDASMARRIGRYMLSAVVADIARWCEAGIDPLKISVNVSEFDLSDESFVARVLGALDSRGLPRSCLTLEVTESVFLGDKAASATEALLRLDGEGIEVELDDFGTGYASLAHLRSIPVKRLKIDRSFVENVERNTADQAIVKAVITLGHNLGHEIVAEGIETVGQAELLRGLGCDLAQGFLFGSPADSVATEARILAEGRAREQRLRTIAQEGKQRPVSKTG